jgi:hypothetical protein
MTNATFVALFVLSLLIMSTSESDVKPVTPENALSEFLYFSDADEKNIKVASELDIVVKSLFQLNDQNPLRLLEVARESHSLVFNHILLMVREKIFFSKK